MLREFYVKIILFFLCRINSSRRINIGSDKASAGFTLIEIMIVIAIMGTLAAVSTPLYINYIQKVRVAKVVNDIHQMEKQISIFLIHHDRLPNNLAEVGLDTILDAWGNPYKYLPVNGTPRGKLRKNRFLVPVNSDYDLYSMGKDGKTVSPFTAKQSRDDIVRANDGGYIGLASDY